MQTTKTVKLTLLLLVVLMQSFFGIAQAQTPQPTVTYSNLNFNFVCKDEVHSFIVTGRNLGDKKVSFANKFNGILYSTSATGPFSAPPFILTPINGSIDQTVYIQYTGNAFNSADFITAKLQDHDYQYQDNATIKAVSTAYANPTITSLTDGNYCKDASATALSVNLTAGSGNLTSLAWYATGNGTALGTAALSGTTANAKTFTPSTSTAGVTNYYAVVTNSHNCTATSNEAVITVKALPTISSVTGETSICLGTATTLTAHTDASSPTFNWYDASGTSLGSGTTYTTPNNLATGATTYNVEVISNGCTSASRTGTTVTVKALPTISSVTGETSICSGTTTTLTAHSDASNPTFNWYDANGGSLGSGATYTTLNNLATGTTTYYVDVTSSSCTSANRTAKQITINALPTVSISASISGPICTKTAVTYSTESGQSAYNWNIPGISGTDYTISGGSISSNTVTITWLTGGGKKTVTVNYNNANGCSAASPAINTISVDEVAPVPVKASLPTITAQCSVTFTAPKPGETYQNSNRVSNKSEDGGNIYTFPWALDNCVGYVRATTKDPLVYTKSGTITWEFNDGNGNISQQKQEVVITDVTAPVLKVPADVTLACGGSTATSVTGRASANDNCNGNITITYTDATNGDKITRTWSAQDAAGNTATANQIITVGTPLNSVSITSTPSAGAYTGGVATNLYLGYGPQSTSLTLGSLPVSGAPYTYSWSGSNLSGNSSSEKTFTASKTGTYTITVTVINKYGCRATASVNICVTDVRASNNKIYVYHVPATGRPQVLTLDAAGVLQDLLTYPSDRLGTADIKGCNDSKFANTEVSNFGNAISNTEILTTKAGAGISTSVDELKVTVLPNPTSNYFTLKLESKYQTPVSLNVFDISGKIIEAKSQLNANSTIQIGQSYNNGTYFAEMIQGNTRKVVQLLKVN